MQSSKNDIYTIMSFCPQILMSTNHFKFQHYNSNKTRNIDAELLVNK